MKIKVGVIFGGATVEHEVSIISAVQAMKHMIFIQFIFQRIEHGIQVKC